MSPLTRRRSRWAWSSSAALPGSRGDCSTMRPPSPRGALGLNRQGSADEVELADAQPGDLAPAQPEDGQVHHGGVVAKGPGTGAGGRSLSCSTGSAEEGKRVKKTSPNLPRGACAGGWRPRRFRTIHMGLPGVIIAAQYRHEDPQAPSPQEITILRLAEEDVAA